MTAAYQQITSGGYVIGAVDYLAAPGAYDGRLYTDVVFASFNVNKSSSHYRFETNVEGTVPADGQLLSLGDANGVKDSEGGRHGNALASDNVAFGTYQTSNAGVNPVPTTEIRKQSGNTLFAKLQASSGQGVDLGDFDMRSGLTLEGWFYPTSTNNYSTNTLLTKNNGGLVAGDYFLRLYPSSTQVNFGIKDDTGSFKEWYSSSNKVVWNQWNYVAVTWSKNTQEVTFHIKQPGGKLFSETKSITDVMGQFPNNSSTIKLGYNAGFSSSGFDGYVDEIRISDFSRDVDELLTGDSGYYRMETTALGAKSVTNGASLRLDGEFQIKDEALRSHGNPVR